MPSMCVGLGYFPVGDRKMEMVIKGKIAGMRPCLIESRKTKPTFLRAKEGNEKTLLNYLIIHASLEPEPGMPLP